MVPPGEGRTAGEWEAGVPGGAGWGGVPPPGSPLSPHDFL